MIILLIIIVTVFVSYQGLKSPGFMEKYHFEVDKVLLFKDYKRLVTSGFLHVSWMHLFFNMFSLYAFSRGIEQFLGEGAFLLIYFASLIGGNLLALLIHRNSPSYSAVGASGAVNGVIFASIALFPQMRIGLFLLPLSIPAWLYGILFLGFSMYAIKSRRENIGHEAHLGGALVGILLTILIVPQALTQNYLPILAILIPTLLFIYLVVTKPHLLLVDNLFYKNKSAYYTLDDRYNARKVEEQINIDAILEKINKKGINSLTKKEREHLERYSKTSK